MTESTPNEAEAPQDPSTPESTAAQTAAEAQVETAVVPQPVADEAPRSATKAKTIALVGSALVGMVLLMVWLAGGFADKVQPQERGALPPAPQGLEFVTIKPLDVPRVREFIGSIAAEHETSIAAQLLGQVAEVDATPGQHVDEGHVLVRLSAIEHQARLAQAEAGLRQATDHHQRTLRQHEAQAITTSQLVEAKNALDAAEARVVELKTTVAKTEIRATVAGVVIDRAVEVGDTTTPGRVLVRLYDRLQLVAVVPESLKSHLKVGQEVNVRVDALGKGECAARIAEIVPEAQAQARAFRVKVTGPCPPGLIPGMFGRMRVPLGTRSEVRIPVSAVRRVGQINMVYRQLPDGALLRQFVTVGEQLGDVVVIVSGLGEGDRIALDAARVPR